MKQPEQKTIDELLKQMGGLADEIIELSEDGHYRDRLINLYDRADTVFGAVNIKRVLDVYESDKKALMGSAKHYQKRAEEAEKKLQQVIPEVGSFEVNNAAWKLHDMLTEYGPLNGHQFNNLKGCFYEALKVCLQPGLAGKTG
ncbi:hypothetical protein [Serratia sp. 14-2641]|uniref:hypothetical protein n=1 Tax=Serratia sp. 14-2641 TaxID=1841657 RepID=UPI00080FF727|nr:hypothetical protein [Serratia sp. 14-2641]OCJ43441.1 hypothetical protein A6U95_20375 [Serratia sp. 14-2641]